MSNDLQARLRRLGVVRGARNLKRTQPQRQPSLSAGDVPALETLLPGGHIVETAVGACYVIDSVYPVSYQHGPEPLAALLQRPLHPAAIYCADERLADLNIDDFLFLDSETTGLAGAGTLAFMVGAAFFERGAQGDVFVVRQYFLRDHGDEPAMLQLLDELVTQKAGLVTFNGRTFDIPLLKTRYLMNRMPDGLTEMPHIDLLRPSRRLWRTRLGSVALSALEVNLLDIQRTHEDVAGWLIPTLYNDYLRSGDASELTRVFYHNQIDMLSMVTLASRVLAQFSADAGTNAIDLYSLGRWQVDLGLPDEGERNLRQAAAADLPLEFYHKVLQQLGLFLKRNGRRQEAVPLWQQWAATSFDSVDAHIELAKHYEWQERDLVMAVMWTQQALTLTASWPSAQAHFVREELNHRLARLQHKQNSQN